MTHFLPATESPETHEAPSLPYTVELARSNRSTCNGCKITIAQGELRLGSVVQASYGDVPMWRHLKCVTDAQRGNLRRSTGSAAPAPLIPGYDDLEATHQKALDDAVSGETEQDAQWRASGWPEEVHLVRFMNKAEVKQKCADLGLKISGSIPVLMERMVDFYNPSSTAAAVAAATAAEPGAAKQKRQSRGKRATPAQAKAAATVGRGGEQAPTVSTVSIGSSSSSSSSSRRSRCGELASAAPVPQSERGRGSSREAKTTRAGPEDDLGRGKRQRTRTARFADV